MRQLTGGIVAWTGALLMLPGSLLIRLGCWIAGVPWAGTDAGMRRML